MKPCRHDEATEGCRVCWLNDNDEAYRKLWSYKKCVHLGGATGEKAVCEPCGDNVRIKLFLCAVHGTCTTMKKMPNTACCDGCPQQQFNAGGSSRSSPVP